MRRLGEGMCLKGPSLGGVGIARDEGVRGRYFSWFQKRNLKCVGRHGMSHLRTTQVEIM